ncbi:NAD(P)-binding protein [Nocardia sp. ET3-3]|uniref:Pyridine nucleotide-disulfide oxidoreductase domain-containing protein 2 n=1 Tax=Nocardia terrae TaxID=2675851 RepID=A0A7K1V5B5_9NOCA|nr:NAD(P)/FAD-dependent oxidoreductase [Nocardia terrae]MVU81672.1 NAD(P)-binding protein [Nocardia terrae]
MSDYDAIVIGAGHNGLTAAMVLQRAGLRTVCLEAKHYSGGMAATVELIDGYRFEIAGSEQFPTSARLSAELELDRVPTVPLEVMSVSTLGKGDAPFVYYTDPMKLMDHVSSVHGGDVLTGMAGLLAWAQAPGRALGRFEVRRPPPTIDEMYACATNEFERQAISDMLFGSLSDVLDRFLPATDKNGALRGMMAFLGLNMTFRGPEIPGSAMSLAFGLATPEGNGTLMRKINGGIGALTAHLRDGFEAAGGLVRLRTPVARIDAAGGRVSGVTTEGGETITAPIVVSSLAPDLTVGRLLDPAVVPEDLRTRFARVDHRASYLQVHFALDGLPEFAEPYGLLNDPTMQSAIGLFSTPEQLQRQWEDCRRGIVPEEPALVLQLPSVNDPQVAPEGKHVASVFALWLPIAGDRSRRGGPEHDMAERVIDRIAGLAPNFRSLISRHIVFTPRHMRLMFGAPGGDYCHGLVHPEQMGPNRPGPGGFRDQPLPVTGLYLGSAGCHGGPAVSFIPGYNAAHQALGDRA